MKTRIMTERPDNVQCLWFWCPGCNIAHSVYVTGPDAWKWDQDREKPTISPSVLCHGVIRCHSFVRKGQIIFLKDCEHALAGKTVDLPDLPDWLAYEDNGGDDE